MRSLKKSASFLLRSEGDTFVSTDLKTVSRDLCTLSFCESSKENSMIKHFWKLEIQTQGPENISKAIPKI